MLIEYHSNNSGGSWWLKDADWKALAVAGWKVVWAGEEFVYENGKNKRDKAEFPVTKKTNKPSFCRKEKGGWRYLGSLSKGYAYKHFDSPKAAMEEFEQITGQNVSDEGCNCCGPPHAFSWNGGYASGKDCLEYLYGTDNPKTLREAIKLLRSNRG